MKLKKITATALILAMCSSMLLTSCGGKSKGAGKGKEIEEMLEDTYGGRFTLTDTVAYRPGISGKLFAALGKADINIRMINQGPDEVNIIFGVENKDFAEAIRVLYNSFIK